MKKLTFDNHKFSDNCPICGDPIVMSRLATATSFPSAHYFDGTCTCGTWKAAVLHDPHVKDSAAVQISYIQSV